MGHWPVEISGVSRFTSTSFTLAGTCMGVLLLIIKISVGILAELPSEQRSMINSEGIQKRVRWDGWKHRLAQYLSLLHHAKVCVCKVKLRGRVWL